MIPRQTPEPDPPAVDRQRICELVEQVAAAQAAGEPLHRHPLLEELTTTCNENVMTYYLMLLTPDAAVDDLVERCVEIAGRRPPRT